MVFRHNESKRHESWIAQALIDIKHRLSIVDEDFLYKLSEYLYMETHCHGHLRYPAKLETSSTTSVPPDVVEK